VLFFLVLSQQIFDRFVAIAADAFQRSLRAAPFFEVAAVEFGIDRRVFHALLVGHQRFEIFVLLFLERFTLVVARRTGLRHFGPDRPHLRILLRRHLQRREPVVFLLFLLFDRDSGRRRRVHGSGRVGRRSVSGTLPQLPRGQAGGEGSAETKHND